MLNASGTQVFNANSTSSNEERGYWITYRFYAILYLSRSSIIPHLQCVDDFPEFFDVILVCGSFCSSCSDGLLEKVDFVAQFQLVCPTHRVQDRDLCKTRC